MKHLKRLEDGAKIFFIIGLIFWSVYSLFTGNIILAIFGSLILSYIIGFLIEKI